MRIVIRKLRICQPDGSFPPHHVNAQCDSLRVANPTCDFERLPRADFHPATNLDALGELVMESRGDRQ